MRRRLLLSFVLSGFMPFIFGQSREYKQELKDKNEHFIFIGDELNGSGLVESRSTDIPLIAPQESTFNLSSPSIYIGQPNTPGLFYEIGMTAISIPKVLNEESIQGACFFMSSLDDINWKGSPNGILGKNWGFPTMMINTEGEYVVSFVDASYNLISTNRKFGQNWESHLATKPIDSLITSSELGVDYNLDSPYYGQSYLLYSTNRKDWEKTRIQFRNWDQEENTWQTPIPIDQGNEAAYQDGPCMDFGSEGQIFTAWAQYAEFPGPESAIAFNSSLDGGKTWQGQKVVIDQIRGMRTNHAFDFNMKVHSKPSIATDKSTGDYQGDIYICWANEGYPGSNYYGDFNIYIIKSEDNGNTWSDPIQVNTDKGLKANTQFLPQITSDPITGDLSVLFYDNRNCPDDFVEVWCANSQDGGENWDDFRVSDVCFRPYPINTNIPGFFTHKLDIASSGGKVVPCWADNRYGAMVWSSPFTLSQYERPKDLNAQLIDNDSGLLQLTWNYLDTENFHHFNIYLDGEIIDTTSLKEYAFEIPQYGVHQIRVTAMYVDEMESGPSSQSIKWGAARLEISHKSVQIQLAKQMSHIEKVKLSNVGELPMKVQLSTILPENKIEYCKASGGGHEYIRRFRMSDVDRLSACNDYTFYRNEVVDIRSGSQQQISVEVGGLNSGTRVFAYLDWNGDGIFEDDKTEKIELNQLADGPYFETAFYVPLGLPMRKTRIRIRCTHFDDIGPCGISDFGEVEDYSLAINEWLSSSYHGAYLESGDHLDVDFSFYSAGLEIGTYQAELQIYSNELDQQLHVLPLELEVIGNPFAVELTAEKDPLCLGDSCRLFLDVERPENCTFLWSSPEIDFQSDVQNPVLIPNRTANYKCEINRGDSISQASIFVTSLGAYAFDLGSDTLLCPSMTYSFEAPYFPLATYRWNDEVSSNIVEIAYHGDDQEEIICNIEHPSGCQSIDTLFVIWDSEICVGMEEFKKTITQNIKVFPNPTKGSIRIATDLEPQSLVSIRITDIQSRTVYCKQGLKLLSDELIQLPNLVAGTYLIAIQTKESILHCKFVKQ